MAPFVKSYVTQEPVMERDILRLNWKHFCNELRLIVRFFLRTFKRYRNIFHECGEIPLFCIGFMIPTIHWTINTIENIFICDCLLWVSSYRKIPNMETNWYSILLNSWLRKLNFWSVSRVLLFVSQEKTLLRKTTWQDQTLDYCITIYASNQSLNASVSRWQYLVTILDICISIIFK